MTDLKTADYGGSDAANLDVWASVAPQNLREWMSAGVRQPLPEGLRKSQCFAEGALKGCDAEVDRSPLSDSEGRAQVREMERYPMTLAEFGRKYGVGVVEDPTTKKCVACCGAPCRRQSHRACGQTGGWRRALSVLHAAGAPASPAHALACVRPSRQKTESRGTEARRSVCGPCGQASSVHLGRLGGRGR